MPTIKVRNQGEWDALPERFTEFTTVSIECGESWIAINEIPGSSHVEAWESSHVEAWGYSHVEARGSSHVVARGSSHVEARGQAVFHQNSNSEKSELYGQSVCFLYDGAEVPLRKSDNATIIRVTTAKGVSGWLEQEGISEACGKVIIYKRVSANYRTQEGRPWETTWVVGEVVSHPAWGPTQECGPGQFHACSRPFFCDEFRSNPDDVYVAIEVRTEDLHLHEARRFPHKISFRSGVVLHQVDRYGNKIGEKRR